MDNPTASQPIAASDLASKEHAATSETVGADTSEQPSLTFSELLAELRATKPQDAGDCSDITANEIADDLAPLVACLEALANLPDGNEGWIKRKLLAILGTRTP